MRITDIFSAIPPILMAVVVVSVLGTDTINLMLAVGISATPHFIRITRASILTVKNQEYVEAALGRKVQENRRRKVTGDVEARICAIACSEPPEGASRWTMQAIADELIRLEVVDYITDSTICEVMKKTKSSRGL